MLFYKNVAECIYFLRKRIQQYMHVDNEYSRFDKIKRQTRFTYG